MDIEGIINYLYDETLSYLDIGVDLFGMEALKVRSEVRGMVDDYFRAYNLVSIPFSGSSRTKYTAKYVELGYNPKIADAFTTALIAAKTKNIGFNFSPATTTQQTGKGEISVDNKVGNWFSNTVSDASELPSTFIGFYKFLPYMALGVGIVFLFAKTSNFKIK